MTKQTRSPHWYHLIGIYVLCIAFIYSIQHNLPEPKLETVPGDIFSEGRAIKNLKYIAEDIGVRPLVTIIVLC
jgi:archaellum component FlaD/FlaE